MQKPFFIIFIVFTFFNYSAFGASFGPRENRLIYEGNKNYIGYRIDNTDHTKAWLAQSWVEDISEKRANEFTSVPVTFRVEPSSTFSVRVMKTGALPEDRESIFWVVTNSIPGGEKAENQSDENAIKAKLSLAYRFKVPMIYRPKSLMDMKSQPEQLKWTVGANNKYISVENPTRFAVQLHGIIINGKSYQGKGISYILSPISSAILSIKSSAGTKINYSVINDYGAINEYESVIK